MSGIRRCYECGALLAADWPADYCDVCRPVRSIGAPSVAKAMEGDLPTAGKSGVELIHEERCRQVERLGWTLERDRVEHQIGQLAEAAGCYLQLAAVQVRYGAVGWRTDGERIVGMPVTWPWEEGHWKPAGVALRNLVKAGALIAAEIDRLLAGRPSVASSSAKATDDRKAMEGDLPGEGKSGEPPKGGTTCGEVGK